MMILTQATEGLFLPMPNRSPELNTIELVWNTLVMRVKYSRLAVVESHVVGKGG